MQTHYPKINGVILPVELSEVVMRTEANVNPLCNAAIKTVVRLHASIESTINSWNEFADNPVLSTSLAFAWDAYAITQLALGMLFAMPYKSNCPQKWHQPLDDYIQQVESWVADIRQLLVTAISNGQQPGYELPPI